MMALRTGADSPHQVPAPAARLTLRRPRTSRLSCLSSIEFPRHRGGARADGIEIQASAWDKVMAHARVGVARSQSLREGVVDEAAQIQLDFLRKTLHDQEKRVVDVEQAIIDLAKRLEAIERTLGAKT